MMDYLTQLNRMDVLGIGLCIALALIALIVWLLNTNPYEDLEDGE